MDAALALDVPALIVVLLTSVVGCIVSYRLIPTVMQWNLKARLFGHDLNKGGAVDENGDRIKVPETMGIVPGVVYILCMIFLQLFLCKDTGLLAEWNAALVAITFTVMLGFLDDVLDLRWRYKLVLPVFASLPIVLTYRLVGGSTLVVLPGFIGDMIGMDSIDIGGLHYVYMALLAVFASNSINIYAGINGLEVGQSIVAAVFVALFDLLSILRATDTLLPTPDTPDAAFIVAKAQLSLHILLPFIFTSLALYAFNKFPSRVFVGDTYTYFAGMVIGVAGILGHSSKIILLFFIPQLLNFIISLPQLVGIVPCPRHRLPRYDPDDGLLHAVPSHLTLINFALRITGPMAEGKICKVLLAFQVVCSVVGLAAAIYLKNLM